MMESVQQELRQRTPGHRILALDSLRGIAALTVVFYHLRLAFTLQPPPWYLLPLFAGHIAVILFFVLSGYVLAMPYWAGKQLAYRPYIVRRFFRIYVPYVAALALSVAGATYYGIVPLPLTHWFYATWHTPLTAQLVVQHLYDIPIEAPLNTAFWSLKYEFEFSIIFPFVCWCIWKLRSWGALIVALLMDVGAYLASHQTALSAPRPAIRLTLLYGSCFIYGALLSKNRAAIAALYARTPMLVKMAVLVLTTLLYFGSQERYLPFAACGVLIFAENSRARAWLETPVPEYLGRVSYSLYLTHGTLLFAMLIVNYGQIPTLALVAAFLILSIVVAHLFCIAIEEPSMRLGRRLTQKRTVSARNERLVKPESTATTSG